jgi:hypothetical protein
LLLVTALALAKTSKLDLPLNEAVHLALIILQPFLTSGQAHLYCQLSAKHDGYNQSNLPRSFKTKEM